MARFAGKVGYGIAVEDPPGSGVWKDAITTESYKGDVTRSIVRQESGEKVVSDVALNNAISILASEFAIAHCSNIKYVEWRGGFWSVTSVEIKPPRLILYLGGVYNGPTE